MEYKPKKKLTEAEKEKKRAHYRENRDKILEHQHSEEYVENRRQQRRNSEKYRTYHKFDMQERVQDPEFREKRNGSYRKYYKANAAKEGKRTAQYRSEHPEESREYMRQYMKGYRAKKKAERLEKKD